MINNNLVANFELFSAIFEKIWINFGNIFFFIKGNVLTASYGATVSWGGPNFLVLKSENTPLDEPLSTSEASIVISIPCFGAIIGTIFYTMVLDRLSRKILLVSLAIPQLVMEILFFNISQKKFNFLFFECSWPGLHCS